MGGLVSLSAAVAVPVTMAATTTDDTRADPPGSQYLAQRADLIDWQLANAALLRTQAPKAAPKATHQATQPRASRSQTRQPLYTGDPRSIARQMLAQWGWSSDQFGCLDLLWTRESGWSTSDTNASSGAYGIPQALPAEKMASAGSDWRTNPVTQIRWGLGYIADRYGTPCAAWQHSQDYNYY